MELTALILIGTLATKLVDFGKFIQNKDWNAASTQAVVWIAGILVILMSAEARAFQSIILPAIEQPLGQLDFWSKIIVGLTITSLLSTIYDFKKAIDNTDSASIPELFPRLDGSVRPPGSR